MTLNKKIGLQYLIYWAIQFALFLILCIILENSRNYEYHSNPFLLFYFGLAMLVPTFIFCRKKFKLPNLKTLLLTVGNIMFMLGLEFLGIKIYTTSSTFSIDDGSVVFLFFVFSPFLFIISSVFFNEAISYYLQKSLDGGGDFKEKIIDDLQAD